MTEENRSWGPLVVDGYLRLRPVEQEIAMYEKHAPDFFKALCNAATSQGLRNWQERASKAQMKNRSINSYTNPNDSLSGITLTAEMERHDRAVKVILSSYLFRF